MTSIVRELRIPYAIDLQSNCTIHADEIQGHLQDLRDTLRLEASASKNTSIRSVRMIVCPGCSQRVYPRHPTVAHGRYFWSHGPNTAYVCPLEGKTIMGPNKINALIFNGRQEGQAHKDLILVLKTLAEQDPGTESAVMVGQYEAPTDAMRAEFPHGRFPDLQFKYRGRRAVLEAQLATITLSGINGRRSFYDRNGACLLWVMRHFEPGLSIRAYMKDIVADQQGVLFSIDDDVIRSSGEDRIFRLRAWQYEYSEGRHKWTNKIVEFSVALEMATPKSWADDFKRRWREAYADKSYREASTDPQLFLEELMEKTNARTLVGNFESESILSVVRLLISLEANQVFGSGHRNLLSLANSFDAGEGYRAMTLVVRALERWKPDYFAKPSMVKALKKARDRLDSSRKSQWGQKSAIGLIREALFPDWHLQ